MSAKQNFLQAHWDWLVALAGLAAAGAVGALFVLGMGGTADDAVADRRAELAARKPAHEGVAAADLSIFEGAARAVKNPPKLASVDPKQASFLGSERRIVCMTEDPAKKGCGRPIPGDSLKCPFCGVQQHLPEKIEVDSDHDGLPNDWEVQYGLNPNKAGDANQDLDKDGFTNLEEFQAKTDPTDPKSHPDYLDSLFAVGAPKQTFLPFWLREANPLPGNTFRATLPRLNAKKYEDKFFSVKPGEAIKTGKIDSGWTLKALEKKREKQKIKGAGNLTREVDVFIATLARADGRTLTLRQGDKKVPVDIQANLVYRRGEEKNFTVTAGDEIELTGKAKYRIVKLRAVNGKSEVTIEDLASKKQKIIQGLD